MYTEKGSTLSLSINRHLIRTFYEHSNTVKSQENGLNNTGHTKNPSASVSDLLAGVDLSTATDEEVSRIFEQSVSFSSSTNDTASLEKQKAQLEAEYNKVQQSSQSSSTSTPKMEKPAPSNTETTRINSANSSDITGVGKSLDISI